MNPILRTTRRFTVAGLAAGALATTGLVGQLALGHHSATTGTTVRSQQSSSSGSSSTPSSSTSSSSSRGSSYTQVPAVNSGGNSGGTDTNTRGS